MAWTTKKVVQQRIAKRAAIDLSLPGRPGKHVEPWERQPGETPTAYQAFCVYRDLPHQDPPIKRTRLYLREHGYGATSSAVWAANHEWTKRAALYDDYMEGRARKRLEESRLRMRERQVKLGVSMQDLAQTTMDMKIVIPESISDVVKLAESGSRIERLAQGESTENVAHGVQLQWSGPAPKWAPPELVAGTVDEDGEDVADEG